MVKSAFQIILVVSIGLAVLICGGCGFLAFLGSRITLPTPTVTYTPGPSATPSTTYTPTVTLTPSDTFTPQPTPSITDTATITLTPSDTPTLSRADLAVTAAFNATATLQTRHDNATITAQVKNDNATGTTNARILIAQSAQDNLTTTADAHGATATFIAGFTAISLGELVSYADKHTGDDVVIHATVFNIIDDQNFQVRLSSGDPVYITLSHIQHLDGIYKGDPVTVYGTVYGVISGTNALGATIQQPKLFDAIVTKP